MDNKIICKFCGKSFSIYGYFLAHIYKTKDKKHQSFYQKNFNHLLKIYSDLSISQKDFYKKLGCNIFANVSMKTIFVHINKFYTPEILEKMRRARISEVMKKLDKSKEHRKKLSIKTKDNWDNGVLRKKENVFARDQGYKKRRSYSGKNNPMYGKPSPSKSGRGKSGFREDIKIFVRSTWEANFIRILNHLNIKYKYEYISFNINNEYNYTPDFLIKNKVYEIKGHAKSSKDWTCECKNCKKGRNALSLLRTNNKDYVFKIIGKKEYMKLKNKFKKYISNWEK